MTDMRLLKVDPQFLQMKRSTSDHLRATTPLAAHPKDGSDEELEKATQQFEALLLNMMIREMRKTVPEATLFPDSMAKELFTDMLDEKIADSMAERGGIGISRMLFDQLRGK